jgi:hypothetical protein
MRYLIEIIEDTLRRSYTQTIQLPDSNPEAISTLEFMTLTSALTSAPQRQAVPREPAQRVEPPSP